MDYDSSACAGDDIKSGLPICGNTFLSRNVLPVSLRQEETAAPSCTNSSIISDIHKTEPANKCGPDLFFVHYELPLESLDAQITDASLRYSGMSDQDIRDAVDSADIYLFYDIQTPDFQCPSGVNALLGSVSPSVARVTKTTLKRGDLSLVVGTN
ncbi:MAG: hypothetical protein DI536_24600 [Archangium gephyra]|uniref:Uncharacterized protein n=1 Tax=Archangium gephyra TaxID=48 RepID=A0A2W5TAB2_9BACT|nr:MAG: hypothetical protein DI536_24600 [Archangium gephyra]